MFNIFSQLSNLIKNISSIPVVEEFQDDLSWDKYTRQQLADFKIAVLQFLEASEIKYCDLIMDDKKRVFNIVFKEVLPMQYRKFTKRIMEKQPYYVPMIYKITEEQLNIEYLPPNDDK